MDTLQRTDLSRFRGGIPDVPPEDEMEVVLRTQYMLTRKDSLSPLEIRHPTVVHRKDFLAMLDEAAWSVAFSDHVLATCIEPAATQLRARDPKISYPVTIADVRRALLTVLDLAYKKAWRVKTARTILTV